MTRGRKPISNELKILRGTLQPCRTKSGLSAKQLLRIPKPPDWLNDNAKFIFRRACDILIIKKRLFKEDLPLIAAYSNEYVTYMTAVEKLNVPENQVITTNSGYEQISPWVSIKNTSLKHLQSISSVLGFDPISRMRFNDVVEKEEDELEKIIRLFG